MISIKQAEISIKRFNDMLPHHLGLLKNHSSNIEKSLALGDWSKIKKEEINAHRVIKQLKNLIIEMDALREKVKPEDVDRFDALMADGRQKAFEGMRDFLEMQLKSPTNTLRSQSEDYDCSSDTHIPADAYVSETMQQLPPLQVDMEQYQLAQRQACLEELESLQQEIGDLNGMFHNMHKQVCEQSESVQAIADNAEEALENVQAGESNLRKALTYKKAMYPVVGALLGTCVGGPIGLVAGLKAGGLAAVGCGILGFSGGSVLKKNEEVMLQGNLVEEEIQMQDNNTEKDNAANDSKAE